MALADIKKKIETEARQEAGKLLQRAREEADAILAEADLQAEKMRQSYERRLQEEEPEVLRRRRIVADMDVQRLELGARREVIGKTFETALGVLRALPAEKYEAFVTALLENAMITKSEEVLVGRKEKVITAAWLEKFNKAHDASLTLSSEKLNEAGGFVLSQGRVDVNCTFDMLVHSLTEDLEADVVERLFSS
ncbi:MAG TPA: V-type ATP synthase subunit E family protein [Synergistaceae bacterium]|nr:V-type ATP synthase subunit E family protein [Synergistaceae bacterium]HQK24813.1 V-type ATP synthase subunit E family protein [Synergistaceae bacterium]